MIKLKNISALLLSVCLMLTVSGCSNSNGNSNNGVGSNNSSYVDPDMYCGGGWGNEVSDQTSGASGSSSLLLGR